MDRILIHSHQTDIVVLAVVFFVVVVSRREKRPVPLTE